MNNRLSRIYRASCLGIVLNLLLAIVKAIVGGVSGSVSILADSINNVTDVLSSVVTFVGTKLAHRKPDYEHPHGHGRIEYLAQVVVGVIILCVGVVAIVGSVPKIERPTMVSYTTATLVVIVVSIVLKLLLARFFKRVGRETQSGSLEASGVDAMFDALLTVGTLIGAMVSLISGISIDGWIGLIISVFIIRSAIMIITDGMADVIGRRTDVKLVRRIREKIKSHDEVIRVGKLVLHEYGPENTFGAVKIEVESRMTMSDFKKLSKEIEKELQDEFGIRIVVGVV